MEHPPDALSYWAFSDVFEEVFFPVTRCSFHGGFGLVALACGGNPNVTGIPKPTFRAYQLLHEAGDMLGNVTGPTPPIPSRPSNCTLHPGMDYLGATIIATTDSDTAGACCSDCVGNRDCNFWTVSTVAGEHRCWLKSDNKGGLSPNPGRISGDVGAAPVGQLCSLTTGVLPTGNSSGSHVDVLVYNHATEGDPIQDCNITVTVDGMPGDMVGVTPSIRRIDEGHTNPLAAFEQMGAPNYTTPGQDQELFDASVMQSAPLEAQWSGGGSATVTLVVPAHGTASIRFQRKA